MVHLEKPYTSDPFDSWVINQLDVVRSQIGQISAGLRYCPEPDPMLSVNSKIVRHVPVVYGIAAGLVFLFTTIKPWVIRLFK
jgi:hypothetical protein